MANISNEIRAFQNAVYGEEVRSSMISAIQKINTVTESCESTVNTFSSNISSATTAANNAASNANTAATNANNAATAANTAKNAANTAASNANAAVTSANNAASNANSAATSANNAEAARVTAENARANAESTRQANESARQSAEQARVSAEATRANSEAARDSAESARQTNEITRQGNERQRQNSETLRENAESSRASGFSDMQAAFADMQRTVIPQATESTMGGVIVGDGLNVNNALLSLANTKSKSGTSVFSDGSYLESLTVHGESVQDGTPTPDAPVPVQVVDGANLLNVDASSTTNSGITYTVNVDGTFIANGTATGESRLHLILDENMRIALGDEIKRGTLTLSVDSPLPANTRLEIAYYNGSTYTNSRTYIASGSNYVVITSPQVTFDRVRIYFIAGSGVTLSNLTIRPMLVHGSTATPYMPYGCIGIVVGDTATSIDLQGNTLASLPDGTHDELHVDSAGRVWIEKNVGEYVFDGTQSVGGTTGAAAYYTISTIADIVSPTQLAPSNSSPYAGGYSGWCDKYSINDNYVSSNPVDNAVVISSRRFSSTNRIAFYDSVHASDNATWIAYVSANPITLYYPYSEPQYIDLGYIDPPAIPEDGATVSVSASITPVIDVSWWENGAAAVASAISKLMDEIKSLKAQVAALATS